MLLRSHLHCPTQSQQSNHHRDTIRVEPARNTEWIGNQVATWEVVQIDDDTSTALMLYREYTWATSKSAPLSADPIEIAARAELDADDNETV